MNPEEKIAAEEKLLSQMLNARAHYPYRIIWGTIDANGSIKSYASSNKRPLNAAARAGENVYVLSVE